MAEFCEDGRQLRSFIYARNILAHKDLFLKNSTCHWVQMTIPDLSPRILLPSKPTLKDIQSRTLYYITTAHMFYCISCIRRSLRPHIPPHTPAEPPSLPEYTLQAPSYAVAPLRLSNDGQLGLLLPHTRPEGHCLHTTYMQTAVD
jgi:hypothetical protein